MRALVVVLWVVGLAGSGCKGDKRDKFDEILAHLEKFKTEMCACKDAACADRVSQARLDYKKTMREKLDKDAKPTPEQDKQGKAFEAELQTCRRALMSDGSAGSAGSADPVEKPE